MCAQRLESEISVQYDSTKAREIDLPNLFYDIVCANVKALEMWIKSHMITLKNLQNQPYKARKMFVAPKGQLILSADFS